MKRTKAERQRKAVKPRKLSRKAPDHKTSASATCGLSATRVGLPETAPTIDGDLRPGEGAEWAGPEQLRFLAELGTGLWRLRQSMIQMGDEFLAQQIRRPYRHFESVWDVLTQAGVEVQDHTGMPFDPGMSLTVIAFQPTPGIERERVTETIKPSVYYKGKSIQMGAVIVGTPEPPSWDAEARKVSA